MQGLIRRFDVIQRMAGMLRGTGRDIAAGGISGGPPAAASYMDDMPSSAKLIAPAMPVETSGWIGGYPLPPRDCVLYAVGDVHGRTDLLQPLIAAIVADAARRGSVRKLLVMLGDYVDRGPDSAGVMDWLCAPPPAGFERVCLKGNHEALMQRFLEDPEEWRPWLANGGVETLASYGIALPEAPGDHRAAAGLQQRLRRAMPVEHRLLLDTMPVSHAEGDWLFVHAGIRPDVALDAQAPDDLIWIRQPFLRHRERFAHMVVHGHTIQPEADLQPNRIGIDTGAFYSGRLTALAVTGDGVRLLTTVAAPLSR